MSHIYWFDMKELDRFPSTFTVDDVAMVTGVDAAAARRRVLNARKKGAVQQLNGDARPHRLAFTDSATLDDKMALIALPVREQVRHVVNQAPPRFTNHHLYRHLRENTRKMRHLFMEALQDAGVAERVEPCRMVANTYWWTRTTDSKGTR